MGFKIGDKVQFKPGPFATGTVTAEVIGEANGFLVTKDADSKVRKARPGSCSKAG